MAFAAFFRPWHSCLRRMNPVAMPARSPRPQCYEGGQPCRHPCPGAASLLAFEAPLPALEAPLAGQFGQNDGRTWRAHRHRGWRLQRRRVGSGSNFPHGDRQVFRTKRSGVRAGTRRVRSGVCSFLDYRFDFAIRIRWLYKASGLENTGGRRIRQ